MIITSETNYLAREALFFTTIQKVQTSTMCEKVHGYSFLGCKRFVLLRMLPQCEIINVAKYSKTSKLREQFAARDQDV